MTPRSHAHFATDSPGALSPTCAASSISSATRYPVTGDGQLQFPLDPDLVVGRPVSSGVVQDVGALLPLGVCRFNRLRARFTGWQPSLVKAGRESCACLRAGFGH